MQIEITKEELTTIKRCLSDKSSDYLSNILNEDKRYDAMTSFGYTLRERNKILYQETISLLNRLENL